MAGSTDWGVELNIRHARAALTIGIERIEELREFSVGADRIDIGAALSLSEIEARLAGRVPLLDELFPQFASRLIRNGATLGGNLGTASPIGDAPPVLLALDASLVLASSQGEREVRLDGYFTGYRQSVKRPDELIKTIRIPRAGGPGHRVPQDRQAPVRRHLERRRRLRAPAGRGRRWPGRGRAGSPRSGSGLGGVAATPLRALAAEDALTGRPWTREVVAAAAEELARAGTPMSDHRASEAYRIAMLRNSLLKFFAENPARRPESMSKGHGPLADRPDRPVVGLAVSHESADLHVTGAALYTQDLVGRTLGTLHAWPVQAPHAHARVTGLRTEAAYQVPGVVRVLTADDVPGVNDAGEKHDEPLFPSEVMYYGHAVCWVLGETLEAARQGAAAVEAELRAAARADHRARRDRAGSYQGHQRTVSRGDAAAALERAAYRFSGELEIGGQEHFYLETQAALALVDENGQIFVQSSTQHPSETQDIVAHVLGLPAHQVTVQCLRMGGGFGGKEFQPHGLAAVAALGATLTGRPVSLRLNRTQDITMTGKRHPFFATWEAGFDDDKRLCALRATLTSNGGWSLDLSEPVLARALCHIDNAYWIPDIEVTGRVAKTNRASNTAFRGFGGPQGMIVIEDILGRCAPRLGRRRRTSCGTGTSTRPARPRRTGSRCGTPSGSRRSGRCCAERSEFARRQARGGRVQRRAPGHQARAGDHPGQVRHLVQPHRVQPGRRAGARVQGRLGADQPRRHRDGPGPAHQDDPGRGDRARRADAPGAARADPHRQGAEHLGHRGQLRL